MWMGWSLICHNWFLYGVFLGIKSQEVMIITEFGLFYIWLCGDGTLIGFDFLIFWFLQKSPTSIVLIIIALWLCCLHVCCTRSYINYWVCIYFEYLFAHLFWRWTVLIIYNYIICINIIWKKIYTETKEDHILFVNYCFHPCCTSSDMNYWGYNCLLAIPLSAYVWKLTVLLKSCWSCLFDMIHLSHFVEIPWSLALYMWLQNYCILGWLKISRGY